MATILTGLGLADWALLALAALLVGYAKTAIGGVAALAVVIFAAVLPARESTGALLPLLLCGDLLALALYRRHGSWHTLVRLLPGVVPGMVLGAVFIAVVDDGTMRVAIGAIVLAMTVLHLAQRARRRSPVAAPVPAGDGGPPREPPRPGFHHHPVTALAVGALAGFATMTANAAGPVMTLYLVLAGLPMLQLLGTGAWFFFVVNLAKVPFSAGLSLISVESLVIDATLVPALLLGAALGRATIRRIDQQHFEVATLLLGAVAAGILLVPA